MANSDKTEQATPHRRQKALEKGQVARTHELAGALAGFFGLWAIIYVSPGQLNHWRLMFRDGTLSASHADLDLSAGVLQGAGWLALRWVSASVLLVWGISILSLLVQGGFVFVGEALAPKLERLSPAHKLGQMFSIAGLSAPSKSLIPFSILLYVSASTLLRERTSLLRLGQMPISAIADFSYRLAMELCWKAGLILVLWAGFDYLLQRQRLERDLRMTKQELREEYKEANGNPAIKARIRRLQRQVRRRRMLKDVPRATVVVTNPTHFAVALEYRPIMSAPVVLAKGCNALAEQVKQTALWHEIPIVENRPLAQALYRSVEVGQFIPAKLYTAVAEILAFLYRAQQQVREPAAGREGR